jgi:hypothetical protein
MHQNTNTNLENFSNFVMGSYGRIKSFTAETYIGFEPFLKVS